MDGADGASARLKDEWRQCASILATEWSLPLPSKICVPKSPLAVMIFQYFQWCVCFFFSWMRGVLGSNGATIPF